MYRLMVVEDEEIIRRGIVKSIPWESLGFKVVGEAKNGKEALDKLKTMTVEVLLTDIKMPIMGGTELSKKARKLYPDIEIVILSGFSDFEYARQAISFRAFDYILKPTNKKKLLAVFRSLKDSMDQKKEEKEETFYKNIYINAGYENLRKEFLKSMIDGDISIFNDFDEKARSLELDFSGDNFTVATIKFDKKSIIKELELSWATDKRLLKFSYSNIIKEALSHVDNVYYIVEEYDTISFVFCFQSQEEQDEKMIPCLKAVSENIQNCLFRQVTVPYTIGIGLSYPSIHHIAKSYNQAQKSIQNNFYMEGQNIQLFIDNNESKYEQNFIQFYPEEMKSAVISIINGNYSETRRYLTSMFEGLIDKKLMPEIVKNYCVALLLMVHSKLTNTDEVEKLMNSEYNEFVKDAITVRELEIYVVNSMVELAKKIDKTVNTNEENQHEEIIDKAKSYIKKHMSEKINLKMISEHVYLSETYFSVLFKKVTGMTYVAYIQKIRMNEAKKLLIDTNYKIYEIAERIGYSDYKYFSGQFRKYVAMTPKEYRKQGRMEKKND